MPAAKVQLDIEGMTCAACQIFVEKTLNEQAGVTRASVNLMMNQAVVEFDPALVSAEQLAAAVEDTGYGAKLPVAGRSSIEEEDAREGALRGEYQVLRWKAITSLGIGSVMMAAMPFWGHDVVWWAWTQMELAVVVMLWAGRSFYVKAWAALRRGSADMNVLVAMGTGAAFVISAASTIWPHWFHNRGMMPQIYFEAVVFIIALVLVGKMLEAQAKRQTSRALQQLTSLQPKQATVRRDGLELEVAIGELRLGDLLVVRPGDRIAADGEVVEGASAVDESMLTGESLPLDKIPGVKVYGGTTNGQGALLVRVQAEGGESVLAQIVRVLREAQGDKAPVQALADQVSAVFVPVVVAIAILSALLWVWIGGADLVQATVIGVAVLVISCPCAMGLAVPTAILAATGRAARRGILIRSGEALERLGEVSVVVLDKTGTITKGKPRVERIDGGMEVLRLAACVEALSEHPLARAIVAEAKIRGLELEAVDQFLAKPGLGVSGIVGGRNIEIISGEAPGAVKVLADGISIGTLTLADEVKESSAAAIGRLKSLGLRVVMLSGDREDAARAIAFEVGIEEVIAGVMPTGKSDVVARLQVGGVKVAMVGDGLNDAPALERADVGIAMASGSDLAIEAGDVALLRGDLNEVAEAIEVSRKTMRVMRQNLFWAFLYNVVGIPVAALGLLNPVVAAGAMALSSVSVVLNSLRLR